MTLTVYNRHILQKLLDLLPHVLSWLTRVARTLTPETVRSIRTQVHTVRSKPTPETVFQLVQTLLNVIMVPA